MCVHVYVCVLVLGYVMWVYVEVEEQLGPHFPPCLRQSLVHPCVYQVDYSIASGSFPASASHIAVEDWDYRYAVSCMTLHGVIGFLSL